MDDELLTLAKRAIGDEFELTPQQAARLRGVTASQLRDDARAMRQELQLPDLDERKRDGVPDSLGGALAWIVGIVVLFVPLSVWRYRRMS
jgi:hypothetical protein